MLFTILVFIIFLCPLIFFHELGHFSMAKLFGVRVETFSIGFGPKILKYKFRDTTYAISLIPLGGYVKMFGDNPMERDKIEESQRSISFVHKGKWARFWIVLGGPLANFIFAFFLYLGLSVVGVKMPQVMMGNIWNEKIIEIVDIKPADLITKINNKDVSNMADIENFQFSNLNSIQVKRGKEFLNLKIKKEVTFEEFFPLLMENMNSLRPAIVLDTNNKEYQIKTISGDSLDSFEEFIAQKEVGIKLISENNNELVIGKIHGEDISKVLYDKGFWSQDLLVKSVQMDSPAHKAGVLGSDIIVELNKKKMFAFDQLRSELQNLDEKEVELGVIRNGQLKYLKISPTVSTINGKKIKIVGVMSARKMLKMKLVTSKGVGFFPAIPVAIRKTLEAIKLSAAGFVKLVTEADAHKNLGGPIAIGQIASDSLKISLSSFFKIMAIISVNLGAINLVPIPILDGGHIMFILIELVNRGPLSRRKMEIAQQFGLSILLALMFFAIFNDFSRIF